MSRTINSFLYTMLIACFCAVSFAVPSPGLAQSTEQPEYFSVLHVDRGALPNVELTLVANGSQLAQIGSFQDAAITISEDGTARSVVSERIEEANLQLGIFVDPRALDALGASGQPRYLEMVGMTMKLMEEDESVRANDLLALFTAESNGGVQSLQPWTQDSSLIFRTILQQQNAMSEVEVSALQDSFLYSLDKFNQASDDTDRVKSLLFFSAGLDGDDISSDTLDRLIGELQLQQIQLHAAQFVSKGEDATPDQALQRLTKETNGHFLLLDSDSDFSVLFQRIAEVHTLRKITYDSNALAPDEVAVALTLADGSIVNQRIDRNGVLIATEVVQPSPVPSNEESTTVAASGESVTVTANEESATVTVPQAPSTVDVGNFVTIPGTNITVQRNVLLASFLSMLLLLALLLIIEFRSRRAKAKTMTKGQVLDAATSAQPNQLPNYYRSQSLFDATNDLDMRANNPTQDQVSTASTRLHTIKSQSLDYLSQTATVKTPAVQPRVRQSSAQPSKRQASVEAKIERNPAYRETFPIKEPNERQTRIASENGAKRGAAADAMRKVRADRAASRGSNSSTSRQPKRYAETPQQRRPYADLSSLDTVVTEVPSAERTDLSFPSDSALYRPLLGYFIRVTEELNLPLRIPIYQLPESGDTPRKIHVGRNGQLNTVVINSKQISREHAVMLQKEGRLYLRDNESKAGTFLNWRRLRAGEELLVRNNDLIGFGSVQYEFRGHGEDEATIAESSSNSA